MTTSAATPISPWAPLRRGTYRMLFLAQLGSNIGTWMQTVAAQWLLVGRPDSATLVSLVQTASLLPVLFLSLPAGVFADTMDRRKLLWVTSTVVALCVGLLAVLTAVGGASPAVLLGFTFLIGCGSALTAPAWQAIQPELVPRAEIPAAAALGSITVNGARAVGPAIAGFLVALLGPAPVFALNAISFLGIAYATFAWHRPKSETTSDPEPLSEAIFSGLRYLRAAPGVRRIILRSVLFAAPASALWALLPVAASSRLGLGAGGYGVLLGALGIGAVAGAVLLPRLRARYSANVVLAASAVTFGIGTLAVGFFPVVPTAVLLIVAGLAWIMTLSTLNATLQLAVPAWVRARGMAAYILAFMGAQAIAAFLWGLLANGIGLGAALAISAGLLVLVAASVRILPLHARTGTFDLRAAPPMPEPALVFEPAPHDGPVLVSATYRVADGDVDEFVAAMRQVELTRRRTGAQRWRLYRAGEDAARFVEQFSVVSWGEHLRQHNDRLTASEQSSLDRVLALAETETRTVEHLFAMNVHPRQTRTNKE
jgi:MFS family permease